jgi:hypothetical protein
MESSNTQSISNSSLPSSSGSPASSGSPSSSSAPSISDTNSEPGKSIYIPKKPSSGMSKGIIVRIIIGGVVVIGTIILIVLCRKRKIYKKNNVEAANYSIFNSSVNNIEKN